MPHWDPQKKLLNTHGHVVTFVLIPTHSCVNHNQPLRTTDFLVGHDRNGHMKKLA